MLFLRVTANTLIYATDGKEKYYFPILNVARNQNQLFQPIISIEFINWREAYLLEPKIIRLNIEVDNGRLVCEQWDLQKG